MGERSRKITTECSSAADLRKRWHRTGLAKEVRRQADYTVSKHEYSEPLSAPGSFNIVATESLDPLTEGNKCNQHSCRLTRADLFAQTAALYADSTYLVDTLSMALRSAKDNDAFMADLFTNLQVLKKLFPLLERGIVKFVPPRLHLCSECSSAMKSATERSGAILSGQFWDAVQVRVALYGMGPLLIFSFPEFETQEYHPLIYTSSISDSQKREVEKWLKSASTKQPLSRTSAPVFVEERVRALAEHLSANVLFDASIAARVGGTLLSADQAEARSILSLDGKATLSPRSKWENLRQVQLPWVAELTVPELIMLRDQASKALPRFRELLAARVGQQPKKGIGPREVAAELKSQALDIEAEMHALEIKGKEFFGLGVGGISLGMVIYGLAAGIPVVAGAGLAATIATLLHLEKEEQGTARTKRALSTKPGFVLLRAKQLLQHRTKL